MDYCYCYAYGVPHAKHRKHSVIIYPFCSSNKLVKGLARVSLGDTSTIKPSFEHAHTNLDSSFTRSCF